MAAESVFTRAAAGSGADVTVRRRYGGSSHQRRRAVRRLHHRRCGRSTGATATSRSRSSWVRRNDPGRDEVRCCRSCSSRLDWLISSKLSSKRSLALRWCAGWLAASYEALVRQQSFPQALAAVRAGRHPGLAETRPAGPFPLKGGARSCPRLAVNAAGASTRWLGIDNDPPLG